MEPTKSLKRLMPFHGIWTTRMVFAGQRTGWWCAASPPRVNAASPDDGCGGSRRRSTRQAKRLIKIRLALGSYGTEVPLPRTEHTPRPEDESELANRIRKCVAEDTSALVEDHFKMNGGLLGVLQLPQAQFEEQCRTLRASWGQRRRWRRAWPAGKVCILDISSGSKRQAHAFLAMSFPQNNNGPPDGSTPINGGGTGTEAPDENVFRRVPPPSTVAAWTASSPCSCYAGSSSWSEHGQQVCSDSLVSLSNCEYTLKVASNKDVTRMGELDSWMDEQFIKSLYQNRTGDNVNIKIILGCCIGGLDSWMDEQFIKSARSSPR